MKQRCGWPGCNAVVWISILALWFAPGVAAEDVRFTEVERVVAIGDVHGAYRELTALLEGVGLVDEALRWSGGSAHLVMTGDLIDRGDQGRQVLELLIRLESEARVAGGAVHVLLGNHEAMVLTGDLRYVSSGDFMQYAENSETGHRPGYLEYLQAFSPDGVFGSWLLDRPAMIVVNDSLFVHGGVSNHLAGRSLEEVNASVRLDLRRFATGWQHLRIEGLISPEADFDEIIGRARELSEVAEKRTTARLAADLIEASTGLPFHPDGLLWYRGTALCHPFVETDKTRALLHQFGAGRVVMGHTPTPDHQISRRLDGLAYRIDTGMNHAAYRGKPTALLIEAGQAKAFVLNQGPQPVSDEPARIWNRPFGMSDSQLEEFLRTAEIVQNEALGDGITNPRRLTLEQDGRTLRAIFKYYDSDPDLQNRNWRGNFDLADRYIYELAAYRIDRLLGLEMVPVAVERTVRGDPGIVQYWIEDAITEAQRQNQGLRPSGACPTGPQVNLMNVFDVLIYNVDRNLGNILYDQDWMLWLIDHTRAFATQRNVPRMIRNSDLQVTSDMRRALEQITIENLEVVQPYLHRRQLQALVLRAERLRRP